MKFNAARSYNQPKDEKIQKTGLRSAVLLAAALAISSCQGGGQSTTHNSHPTTTTVAPKNQNEANATAESPRTKLANLAKSYASEIVNLSLLKIDATPQGVALGSNVTLSRSEISGNVTMKVILPVPSSTSVVSGERGEYQFSITGKPDVTGGVDPNQITGVTLSTYINNAGSYSLELQENEQTSDWVANTTYAVDKSVRAEATYSTEAPYVGSEFTPVDDDAITYIDGAAQNVLRHAAHLDPLTFDPYS